MAIALATGTLEIPLRSILATLAPAAGAALLMVAVLFPVENLVVHAADHGTALGLLLLTGEVLFGAALYLLALRVLAPGLGSEFKRMIGDARRRPRRETGQEGDDELVEEESDAPLPG